MRIGGLQEFAGPIVKRARTVVVNRGEGLPIHFEPYCGDGLRIPLLKSAQGLGTQRHEEVLNET